MPLVLLAICAAFCVACGIYDVSMTEKGLKAGVAVEGDTWLVGKTPSTLALYLRDSLVLVLCAAPSIAFYLAHNTPLAWGAAIGPVPYGIHHIQGGLAWAKLLKK